MRRSPIPLNEKGEVQTRYLLCEKRQNKYSHWHLFIYTHKLGKTHEKWAVIAGTVEWMWELEEDFSSYASDGNCCSPPLLIKSSKFQWSHGHPATHYFPQTPLLLGMASNQELVNGIRAEWGIQVLGFQHHSPFSLVETWCDNSESVSTMWMKTSLQGMA